MTLVCPSCGRENPDDARFCGGCATPLTVESTARREERKVVTVVFADLVGSTARAERLDPEDVRAILAPYHERLRDELERHGGTVEKFIGDAVVGVFGAPVAHEDDPERAVRAALTIQDAISELNVADPRLELEVRVGVHSGEALVTIGVRPELGEAMVAGDVMNTAARLQSAAPPGGILVGESTYRATERAIEYSDHDPVTAKGKSEPLRAWLAVARRSRYGIDLGEGLRAPLVGRTEELDVLSSALSRVQARREAQLVTLVGVPGIGKSRLVQELFQVVEQTPELINWRQGRSLPYGEGVALWALGEMVKAQAGILESDRADDATAKLSAAVRDLVSDDVEARWIERHLRPLAGIREGISVGEASLEEAFTAWRRFLESMAESRPTILVFEDLHWADDALLDFVDSLADRVVDVPLLVVCSARPELLERRPGWGGGKRNATTLSIAPLSDEETARLLGELLDRAVLPAEQQLELLQRAGGIPLFAEEYVRMQHDGGTADVPETLHGIVAARIDGLPRTEKALLQAAAVLGKVFWTDALAALADTGREGPDEMLFALERKEFVRRERRSAVAGARQLAFVHALVRDAAYGQVPRAERARLHRRAAEWIETLAPDRSEDRAEMLAHHYVAAFDYARSAGIDADELGIRAATALTEAGDRAYALNAYMAAARYYASARELGPLDPKSLLAFGRALSSSERGGDDQFAAAAEAALAVDDVETAAEAEMERGILRFLQGDRDAASSHFDRASSLVAAVRPSRAKAFVTSSISRFNMLAGRSDDAIRTGSEALAMAEELGLHGIRAHALNNIGTAKANTGDRSGLDDLRKSIDISLEHNLPEARRGLNNLASLVFSFGDIRRAEALSRDSAEVSERFGIIAAAYWDRAELAFCSYYAGRWDEAMRELDSLIEQSEEETRHYMEAACRDIRSRMSLARGDVGGAVNDVTVMLELAAGIKDPQVVHPSRATAANLFVVAGRLEDASTQVDALLAELEDENLADVNFWAPYLAAAMDALGRGQEFLERAPGLGTATPWLEAASCWVRGEFGRAADLFGEIGSLPDEALARLRAAEKLVAAGRRSEADEQLARALAFWRSVGATRYIRDGEALLAQAS
ncbi:MAG TPA: adenylate/guanylate cyclase domain-containing protein [Gaiellaceae bacterium]|nr:adenylate/guanylate cyclase domain-containing protein [Gaiellaceae bacterium]